MRAVLEGGPLFGFVLYDQKGRPCVSFGYADDKKATWVAIVLRQHLRTQSKSSVAEL